MKLFQSLAGVVVFVLVMFLPSFAESQSLEPEWRVINEEKPKVIPPYMNAENPFPMIAEQQTAPVEVVSVYDAAAEEAKKTLANALADARNLIASDRVYQPDLSGIKFTARVEGQAGPKVFYNQKWLGLNETITVPVKGVQAAYRAIKRLEELDPELAKSVSEELSTRISTTSSEKLTISSIEESKVMLTGRGGKQYVISLRRSGW